MTAERSVPDHAIAFLEELGAGEIDHRAERSLLTHLIATHDLLAAWQRPAAVALAGLYHSIYGTSHFERACLAPEPEQRNRVRAVIGEAAEHIAYLFSAMDRDAFLDSLGADGVASRFGDERLAFDDGDVQALCEILLANELDLAIAKKGADRPDKIAKKVGPCFERVGAYVSDTARAAYHAATG